MSVEDTTTQEEVTRRLSQASSPETKSEIEREYLRQQQRYDGLRYKVSAALLVACPVLALLPPRKIDWYTFGLGSAWLYCLTDVSSAHGRDMLLGFRRKDDIALKMAQKPEAEGVKVGGWRGDRIKDYRKREQEAESYGSIIMEQIWDVWEQKDRNKKGEKADPGVNVREEILKKIEEDARD